MSWTVFYKGGMPEDLSKLCDGDLWLAYLYLLLFNAVVPVFHRRDIHNDLTVSSDRLHRAIPSRYLPVVV